MDQTIGVWNVRTLKRQYHSSLYERLALSRDKNEVMIMATQGAISEHYMLSMTKVVTTIPAIYSALFNISIRESNTGLFIDMISSIGILVSSFKMSIREKSFTFLRIPL